MIRHLRRQDWGSRTETGYASPCTPLPFSLACASLRFFCSTDHLRVLTWVKEKKGRFKCHGGWYIEQMRQVEVSQAQNVTYWICGTFGDMSRNCFHSRTEGKVSQGNNVECCNCGGNQFPRGLAIPQKQRIRKKGKRQRQHKRRRPAQERERQQRPFPARGRQWEPHSAFLGDHDKQCTTSDVWNSRRQFCAWWRYETILLRSSWWSRADQVQLRRGCSYSSTTCGTCILTAGAQGGRLHRCEWQRNSQLWLKQVSDGRRVWSERKQQRVRLWRAWKSHSKTLSSCKGLLSEYQRLRELHGNPWILPPYREGWLYKCFPRCANKLEMALVEAHRASRGSSRKCVHQLQWPTNHRHWCSRMPQHDHHNLWNRFLNRVWLVITIQMVREEESLREVKCQMRAVPMQRERRLGFALASDDPLLALIPTCSGDVIRVIGAVRMERLLVKEIRVANGLVHSLELKERVFMREARARINRPKQDWAPPLVEIRYAHGRDLWLAWPYQKLWSEVARNDVRRARSGTQMYGLSSEVCCESFHRESDTCRKIFQREQHRRYRCSVFKFQKSQRHPTLTCLDWTLPSVARHLFAQCLRSCLEDSRVERIQI